jgi:hypothetical protein
MEIMAEFKIVATLKSIVAWTFTGKNPIASETKKSLG